MGREINYTGELIMKKIVSIYISIFLVFSTSLGQTQYMPLEAKFGLRLRSGELIRATFLNELREDSLFFDYPGGTRSIHLNSITEIKRIKKNKISSGLVIGGGVAGLISLALTWPKENPGGSDAGLNALTRAIFTTSGMILGTIVGAILGIDKVHDLSNLSPSDKISLILGLIESQKD